MDQNEFSNFDAAGINPLAILYGLPSDVLTMPVVLDPALLANLCPTVSRRFVSHDDPDEDWDAKSDEEIKREIGTFNRAVTWLDDRVKAARVKRDKVTVTVCGVTTEFVSCRAAFERYGFQMSKCARFRGRLKKEQRAVYLSPMGTAYTFAIAT